jgi:hypothetical protein
MAGNPILKGCLADSRFRTIARRMVSEDNAKAA